MPAKKNRSAAYLSQNRQKAVIATNIFKTDFTSYN